MVDFIRAGDTLMVLSKEGGIMSSNINYVERQMLSSPISGLLPIYIDEFNLKITLKYVITGKKMLSHCLKSDKLSLSQFYSLMLQIITTLEDSKTYMLTPENYILEEDYIFVEGALSCGVLYLTYVPLNFTETRTKNQQNVQQNFLSLVTSLLSNIQSIEGNGVQQLLALCKDETFSFKNCKKLLLSLLSDKSTDESTNEVHTPLRDKGVEQQATLNYNLMDSISSIQPGERNTQEEIPLISTIEDESPSPRIKPMYILLSIVVVDALWWRFVYLNHQGKVNLYISIGITLLLGLAYWILTSKNNIFLKKEAEYDQQWRWNSSVDDQSYSSLVNNQSDLIENEALSGSIPGNSSLQQSNFSNPPLENSPTVLLHNYSVSDLGEKNSKYSKPQVYLERYAADGGIPEKIVLDRKHFIIGRDAKLAQYIEKVAGVSRAHVELKISSDGCTLKDLGSRNGTKLNSEWIAPYKEHSVKVGESFNIAGVSYKYCIS